MSGGSMNYIYCRIEEYAEMFEDPELILLAKDFANLAHDCEWMHSGDTGRGEYRKSCLDFKKKWLGNKIVRQHRIIATEIEKLRNDLMDMLGGAVLCKDCIYFEKSEKSDYGECENCAGHMVHGYDLVCEKYRNKGNLEGSA
mgnify:CR=1 FL=1